MRMRSMVMWSALAVGCRGTDPAAQRLPSEPPIPVRRAPEPDGKDSPAGGTAIRTGLDRDRDGVLGKDEVGSTPYVRGVSTAQPLRRDPITPGSSDCEHFCVENPYLCDDPSLCRPSPGPSPRVRSPHRAAAGPGHR